MIDKIREPINSITHFIGALLSIIAFALLLHKSIANNSVIQIVTSSIFCIGLIGLYSTSSLYHGLKKNPKVLEGWRKADHIMIYILIASTYTPICILTIKGTLGITLLSIIWAMTILGIVAKVLWLNMPRKLYTAFYLILGWAAVFAIMPIYKSIGTAGVMLLIFGGLAYTVGAVIYAKKFKLFIWKFGFHEIFHLFILLGSSLHFLMIYNYAIV